MSVPDHPPLSLVANAECVAVCAISHVYSLPLQAQLAGTPQLVPEAERVAIFPEAPELLGVSDRESGGTSREGEGKRGGHKLTTGHVLCCRDSQCHNVSSTAEIDVIVQLCMLRGTVLWRNTCLNELYACKVFAVPLHTYVRTYVHSWLIVTYMY